MRECCANLELRSEPEQLKDDFSVSTCTECGAKHYELAVDPAYFDLTGAGLS